jgi:DNA-binding transcriptional ArsR family regulator
MNDNKSILNATTKTTSRTELFEFEPVNELGLPPEYYKKKLEPFLTELLFDGISKVFYKKKRLDIYQVQILQFILRYPDEVLSSVELAKILNKSRSTINKKMESLVDYGLVKRMKKPKIILYQSNVRLSPDQVMILFLEIYRSLRRGDKELNASLYNLIELMLEKKLVDRIPTSLLKEFFRLPPLPQGTIGEGEEVKIYTPRKLRKKIQMQREKLLKQKQKM